MRRAMSRILSAFSAVMLLLLCMASPVLADFRYEELKCELPIVNAVGSYDLKDMQTGEIVDTLYFDGSGAVSLTVDEPGNYEYLLLSRDERINTADYRLTVCVITADRELQISGVTLVRVGTETKVDELRNYEIVIKKIREGNPAEVLAGAGFGLYTEEAFAKINAGGRAEPIVQVTTDKNGLASLGNLQPDVYYLLEEKAPEGYERIEKYMKLEIRENDSRNPIRFEEKDCVLEKDGRTCILELDNAPVREKDNGKHGGSGGHTSDGTDPSMTPTAFYGTSAQTLPQTGQLWWPAALMSALGLLVGAGLYMKRSGQKV